MTNESARSEFEPIMHYPKPKGWTPKHTYTGLPGRYMGHSGDDDRFDRRPSRNPYPHLPNPNISVVNPMDRDVHLKSQHRHRQHIDRMIVMYEGGDRTLLVDIKRAIRNYQALREEQHGGIAPIELETRYFNFLHDEKEGGDNDYAYV